MTTAEMEAIAGYIDAAVELAVVRALKSLPPKEPGPPGPQGEKGERGEKGDAGPSGNSGEKGEAGPAGARGPRGEKGIDGRDGRDGKDGIASRDELKALVDEYVTAAVPPVVKSEVDTRDAQRPDWLFRGVWTEGDEYARGNSVQWAGNLWHANEKTQTKPGDGNPAWTLMVRRGRDAK